MHSVAPTGSDLAQFRRALAGRATLGPGFRSSTADLTAAAASRALSLRAEVSLVEAVASDTGGAMSGFTRLADALPAGHRAMVLRTYETVAEP